MLAKNTTTHLKNLRDFMKSKKYAADVIQAYVIPSGDAHQSEYIAPTDCRRQFISGFSGSAGTAIVTTDKAALWTDGRYFLQADKELDSNWVLMKDGLPDTKSQGEWLCDVLPSGGKVAADPYLLSKEGWKRLSKELVSSGHTLIPVETNLIDLVWDEQPVLPYNHLLVLESQYAGQSWQDKVNAVQAKMTEKNVKALVVTALDEVAWLFNMRGTDIDYNPVFFAYAFVTLDDVHLFTLESRMETKEIKEHLKLNEPDGVMLHPYGDIAKHIKEFCDSNEGKIWVSDKSSFALFSLVPKLRRYNSLTPICLLKALKNETEISGMRNAHIKDAVTLCEYFSWLEKEVPKGDITECSAADKLENIKRDQEGYKGLSFTTISSVGANAAVIHYKPKPETASTLNTEEIYLCDSGAQYLDGTTDVTRTVHFGNPSQFEKECFTRVLKGHIRLSSLVFPNGIKGHLVDCIARLDLWKEGLDYRHGTGHGVGSYLNVHEGPCNIGQRIGSDVPMQENMFFSDEPGYYEDGKFGIRIENVVVVKKSERKHNFGDKGFLTFEPVTLVPIQTKLIDPALMTEQEISWLNDYHTECREKVGPELKKQGKTEALKWLMKESVQLG